MNASKWTIQIFLLGIGSSTEYRAPLSNSPKLIAKHHKLPGLHNRLNTIPSFVIVDPILYVHYFRIFLLFAHGYESSGSSHGFQ